MGAGTARFVVLQEDVIEMVKIYADGMGISFDDQLLLMLEQITYIYACYAEIPFVLACVRNDINPTLVSKKSRVETLTNIINQSNLQEEINKLIEQNVANVQHFLYNEIMKLKDSTDDRED